MTDNTAHTEHLTLGLDIGIASVGWALLGSNRIIDIGVRCFDRAETAKEGESINLARRMARLTRRRLRRRAWRLTKLARLFEKRGLIENQKVLKEPPKKGQQFSNPWQLRVDGLDRLLDGEEWARVIYHLCKHRGFHWISKAEAAAAGDDKEGGKVKKGLSETQRLLDSRGYRSVAEMILGEHWRPVIGAGGEAIFDRSNHPVYEGAARNKGGDYSKSVSRVLLDEELRLLFQRQREFKNPFASTDLENEVLGNGDQKSGLFWAQKPALSGQDLLKMLGKCTFEKAEYRAPKACFSAERHVVLTRINNLRLIENGTRRALTEEERQIALALPYSQSRDLTFKQLAAALVKEGHINRDDYRFAGLSYPRESDGNAKSPEAQVLVKIPGWHAIRKALSEAGLEDVWRKISLEALEGTPKTLDEIATVLSVYKDDDEVFDQLSKLALSGGEQTIVALQSVRFDKFSNLSLKALNKILPEMLLGRRYDEACASAGYHHSLHDTNPRKQKYLPPLYSGRDSTGAMILNEELEVPRNPVVLRALNQARKIVNALVRKHGSPHAVHIEMARDLSRPFDERRKIQRAQQEYQENNQKGRTDFANQFGITGSVRARDLEKWMLYREQMGKCAYSLQSIDLNRLLEAGYVEVDHVLPYSRSFDDSKNNRVLVLTHENRNKGNQTPYEYLNGESDSEQWQRYESFVRSNKSYRQAKRNRLLKRDFAGKEAEGFRDRHLNDTRYICRFFKNYVEKYLQFHEDSTAKRCVVVSGQLTSFLRFRWGLIKDRQANDRHHAVDAAIVAACSHGMVKRLSDYSRRQELEKARNAVDAETGEIMDPEVVSRLEQHFPEPWMHFREELMARVNASTSNELMRRLSELESYPEDVLSLIRPLFVSRAVKRRGTGAAHKETIYGQTPELKQSGGVKQKVDVSSLSPKDIDKLIDPDRNQKLYAYLKSWLAGRDANIKKAKALEKQAKSEKRDLTQREREDIETLTALPRKPDKHGEPTGPIVRSVTMVIPKLSGVEVRGGIAKNDSMIRVDVFEKGEKFFLVPVYVYHLAGKELPDRAAKANTPRDKWDLIDESYEFKFALYPNDLVHLKTSKAEYFGYFSGMDVSTAGIAIKSHDNDERVASGKAWQGTWRNLGVKTGVICFDKYHVDILGRFYKAEQEDRDGLA